MPSRATRHRPFTVIKNDSSASYNGQQYMAQVPGLGAKMYSIGFCLAADSAREPSKSMQYVIQEYRKR